MMPGCAAVVRGWCRAPDKQAGQFAVGECEKVEGGLADLDPINKQLLDQPVYTSRPAPYALRILRSTRSHDSTIWPVAVYDLDLGAPHDNRNYIPRVFVARNTAPNLKQLAYQMARVDNRKAASHYFQSGEDNSGEAASQGLARSDLGRDIRNQPPPDAKKEPEPGSLAVAQL
jgi:hypothetical protein